MGSRVFGHLMNTPQQAREYLQEALDIVEGLDPPEDLRVTVFTAAAGLVSAKTATIEQDLPTIIPEGMLRAGH